MTGSKCMHSKVPQNLLEMGKQQVTCWERRKKVKLEGNILEPLHDSVGFSLVLDWGEAFSLPSYPP